MTIEDICELYKVATDEEGEVVRAFISAHDFIVPYLREAHEKLRGIFGDMPQSLTISYDPVEDWTDLFIQVQTDISTQEARDTALGLLDRFDNEYWIDTPDSVREVVGVDIEPPQKSTQ